MKSLVTYTLAALALTASLAASAATLAPFSKEAFEKAQAEGKPVAVHFHAAWCGTCIMQQRVLSKLEGAAGPDVLVLTAKWNDDKALQKQLSVDSRSVLVVYKGKTEVARVEGNTQREVIVNALTTATK